MQTSIYGKNLHIADPVERGFMCRNKKLYFYKYTKRAIPCNSGLTGELDKNANNVETQHVNYVEIARKVRIL